MANLSTLTIQLDGNSAKLVKELAKAQKRTGKFSQKMKRQIKTAAKSFAVLGAAAGAAATAIVASQLKSIDALAKTSDKLGITTKNLAGLTQAAKITGVEQSVLNKALVRQQKAVADANNGLETYARQFRALNIDTKELAKLNPAEQFKVIADALNKVENQTQKTAIAYDIFGGRATDLINTMRLGSEGLNAFEEEAESLGLAISRIDAAKVEAANDAMVRAGGAVQGLGNKLTIALAPYIEEASLQFVEAMKNGEEMGQGVSDAVESAGKAVAFVADAVHGLGVAFQLANAIANTAAAGMLTGFSITFTALTSLAEGWLNTWSAILDAAGNLPDSMGGQMFRDAAAAADEAAQGIQNAQDYVDGLADSVRDNAAEAWTDLHNAAMEELPSVGINKYFDNLEARAQAGAEAIAAAANANVSTAGGEVQTALAPLDNSDFQEKLQERLAMQIEHTQQAHAAELEMDKALDAAKLEQQALTDETLIAMATEYATQKVMAEWEAKQAALGETGQPLSEEDKVARQAEIEEQSLAIAADMANRRAKIEADKAKAIQKYDLATMKGKVNTLNATANVMAAFGKKSEKLQKIASMANQAIALKDAVVNTAKGVTNALASMPYPANLAAAASVAIAGAVQIGTIAGAGYGGGSGGGYSGGGAVTPSYASGNVADSEEVTQRKSESMVTVNIAGNLHADEDYLWNQVIPGIQEAVKEKDVVFIDADSRQAEELALA